MLLERARPSGRAALKNQSWLTNVPKQIKHRISTSGSIPKPPILRVRKYPESGGAQGTATAPPRRRLASVTRTRPGDPAMESRPHHRRGGANALTAAVMPDAPRSPNCRRPHLARERARRRLRGSPKRNGQRRRTGATPTQPNPHGARAASSQRHRDGGRRAVGSREGTESKATMSRSNHSSIDSRSAVPCARAPLRYSMLPERRRGISLGASNLFARGSEAAVSESEHQELRYGQGSSNKLFVCLAGVDHLHQVKPRERGNLALGPRQAHATRRRPNVRRERQNPGASSRCVC